jgi:hypothetical protein
VALEGEIEQSRSRRNVEGVVKEEAMRGWCRQRLAKSPAGGELAKPF